jgi:hypothetical protein
MPAMIAFKYLDGVEQFHWWHGEPKLDHRFSQHTITDILFVEASNKELMHIRARTAYLPTPMGNGPVRWHGDLAKIAAQVFVEFF